MVSFAVDGCWEHNYFKHFNYSSWVGDEFKHKRI